MVLPIGLTLLTGPNSGVLLRFPGPGKADCSIGGVKLTGSGKGRGPFNFPPPGENFYIVVSIPGPIQGLVPGLFEVSAKIFSPRKETWAL